MFDYFVLLFVLKGVYVLFIYKFYIRRLCRLHSNTTGATSWAGTANPFEAHAFNPVGFVLLNI